MIESSSLQDIIAGWLTRFETRRPAHKEDAWKQFSEVDQVHFHRALARSYGVFAARYPQWACRGFDERFLASDARMLLVRCWQSEGRPGNAPTGMDVARLWEHKFGVLLCGAERVQRVADLAHAASVFLTWFICESRVE